MKNLIIFVSALKTNGILLSKQQQLFHRNINYQKLISYSTISTTTTKTTSSDKFWLVSYEYNPENILERRAPLRPLHLAMVKEYADQGKLLLGGAFADPVDGAAIIFKGTKEEVEGFIRKDPYVTQGIVTKHRIREWTVVAGAWV